MKPINRIIDLGSVFFQIDREVLISRLRDDTTARIRFSIMGACRNEGYSLNVIGAAFNRDHGTVMHAIRNLNPDTMAAMWEKHLRFVEAVKCTDLNDDDLNDVGSVTQKAILDIDAKIAGLQEIRRSMVATIVGMRRFEVISTETPAHWQEKG